MQLDAGSEDLLLQRACYNSQRSNKIPAYSGWKFHFRGSHFRLNFATSTTLMNVLTRTNNNNNRYLISTAASRAMQSNSAYVGNGAHWYEPALDLMHNDVKQCFRASNVHCGSCIHERIQHGVAFPWSGKFKWQYADMCSDVAGPSSSGSGDLFDLWERSNETQFTISPTSSIWAWLQLPEAQLPSNATFVACYVIIYIFSRVCFDVHFHRRCCSCFTLCTIE